MDIKQVLGQRDIQAWIAKDYRNKKAIDKLKKEFLHNQPFAHIAIPRFFNKEKIAGIRISLEKEAFFEKEADLFHFLQTNDLTKTESKEILEFITFLKGPNFLFYMEYITEEKTKSIDMAGSVYLNTHFLLPHDDQLKGRKIAYMLYLSDLKARDGGKLLLYNTKNKKPLDPGKAIVPQTNTFTFFRVSPRSFHEVEEVITDIQRITLGGWFHA